jgi:hypothetical protein
MWGREEDRPALVALAGDDLAEIPPSHRIQSAHGFVQDQQSRISQERLTQRHALQHALAERPHGSVGAVTHGHCVQDTVDARLEVTTRQPQQPAEEPQVLPAGEMMVVVGALRHEADTPFGVHGAVIQAEHPNLTLVQIDEPGDRLDRRGLTGTVGPQETEHLSGPDLETQAPEHLHRLLEEPGVVGLDEMLHLETSVHRPSRWR